MHFFRLIRPLNLLIIGLTMYGLGWYYESMFLDVPAYGIRSLPFLLLVVSTVIIAAAGNIINDYFDVKADRINKPNRLIIGKFVKRRVAIVSHWGLNLIAFTMALIISWKLDTFAYLFIHVLTINLLWFYSTNLKRRFLLGNVLIAGLTATVPMLVGLYFYQIGKLSTIAEFSGNCFPFGGNYGLKYILFLSTGLAIFAFILNLAREIVKDMEDVEGDKKLNAQTLPIVMGYQQSGWAVNAILLLSLIAMMILWMAFDRIDPFLIAPIIVSACIVVIALITVPRAKNRKDYRRINTLIKMAMIAGLLTPIYWNLIMLYGEI